MNRTAFVLASLASLASFALGACRSDPNPGGGVDAPVTGGMHIQDVQNDSMAPGTPVALSGVVVTAIDTFGAKTGDIWVEEPGGGAFSGVHVFGAPVAQITALAVGDIVSIAGAEKDEFTYMGTGGVGGDTSGRSVTELKPVNGGMMSVTKTGTGTVPAPQTVDALAIGQMATQAARDAEWEKWEGVLITVTNASALNDPKCVGSACSDPTNVNFSVTGGLVVESTLAAFPTPAVVKGDCLGGITGVEDYFFDYLLLPTATANVTKGGTGCAVAEGASHAVCSDGLDNDGNGFTDCADNGCIIGDGTCRATTTISAIQAATPTGAVGLDAVFVTAVSSDKRSIWISSSLTAAPNQGVYVYSANNGAVVDAAVVPGAKVNVIGKGVSEYNDDTTGGTLTEVNGLAVTIVTPTGVVVPVTGQTVAQLLVAGTAPTYESVLVTLTNVNTTTLGAATNGYVATGVQAGTTFKMGTDIVHLAAADMGCHATITGLWTNLVAPSAMATTKPNVFGFIPLTGGTGVGTCN